MVRSTHRPNDCCWRGYRYTTFFIDPEEKLIGVCMAQISPSGKATLNDQFEALAHQAIVD